MKKVLSFIVLLAFLSILASCSTYDGGSGYYFTNDMDEGTPAPSNEHQEIVENPFVNAELNNKSNISLSANTAAYSFIRSQIGRAHV